MRPKLGAGDEPTAVRVKDGRLVVTDRLGRRSAFPIGGREGPCGISRFLVAHKNAPPVWHWVVVDGYGRAFFDLSETYWKPEDVAQLGQAAGIPVDPEALKTHVDDPPHRPDHVDPDSAGASVSSLFFYIFFAPMLIAGAGTLRALPWLWPALWLACAAVTIGRRARNDAVATRAHALLPPDETPPEPLRTQDVPTRALLFGAIALLPPMVAHLL